MPHVVLKNPAYRMASILMTGRLLCKPDANYKYCCKGAGVVARCCQLSCGVRRAASQETIHRPAGGVLVMDFPDRMCVAYHQTAVLE